ncbi:hypothetical protein Tco_0659180 [Tanacetum coccineum]
MEASERRRSMLDYKIQQLSTGLSEGSVQDVSNDEENKAGEKVAEKQAENEQLNSTHYTVISMVIEKTASTPTPPTTQAQITNVFESVSSLKFEQRLSELEMRVETMPKRDWTEKDKKTD